MVVPSEASSPAQKGHFVFAVKPDKTAESPRSPSASGYPQIVSPRASSAGERVVTDGQLRLIPGEKVEKRSRREPS